MNKTDYYMIMSSILFIKARFAFLSELFDILQYNAVAETNPSKVPIISEFFISLPPDIIVRDVQICIRGSFFHINLRLTKVSNDFII